MKLASNKQTVLENLFDLILDLKNEELELFEIFLKENGKITVSRNLFDTILALKNSGHNGKTIYVTDLNLDQADPNKPISYLYEQLLAFVAEQFSKTDLVEQKIRTAEKKLIQIRALYSRKQHGLAIAELLKLENSIKEIKERELYNYHHFGIVVQIANLKVKLFAETPIFFKPDELDKTMHNLFRYGDFLLNNDKLSDIDMEYYKKHQLESFHILSMYFAEKEKYSEVHKTLQRLKNYAAENYNKETKLEVFTAFYEIYELLLNLRHNDSKARAKMSKLPADMPLVWVMLFEQLAFDIKTTLNIQDNKLKINTEQELFIQAENKLNSLAFTNNYHTAVQFLVAKEYQLFDQQIKLIEKDLLKSARKIKGTENANFNHYKLRHINVLFLKLINFGSQEDSNYKPDLNKLTPLLELFPNLVFEKQAVELFKIWLTNTKSGKKEFPEKKKEEIIKLKAEMEMTQKNGEMIHRLIIHAFENNI